MRVKSRTESEVVMTQLMLPSHANFGGKIHGGYILDLMDQVAFSCGSRHSGHYCVTASVNKVNFLNPIEVGELVTLKASVNYTGRTSMVIGLRVESENIQTGEVKHCNSSYFTMVAKHRDGRNAPVPGLRLQSVNDARLFARSIERQKESRMRDQRFNSANFDLDSHRSVLQDCNAVLEIGE